MNNMVWYRIKFQLWYHSRYVPEHSTNINVYKPHIRPYRIRIWINTPSNLITPDIPPAGVYCNARERRQAGR